MNPEANFAASGLKSSNEVVDQSKAISDSLLSKFFANIDQGKFANLAKNLSPDAQFYVSKNLNDLRDKFAVFVKKFIDPK